MSNPVASMVSDYIIQALQDCSSYVDASAVQEMMSKTASPPNVPINQLVLRIDAACAVSKLTSKSFHDEVAQAVYNMIKSVPFLSLSHKFAGDERTAVAGISNYLGEILAHDTVEGCVKGFNTSQVVLTTQGSWSALTQPKTCQLRRVALCIACPEKMAVMFEADMSKMAKGSVVKGSGSSYWWIFWVILIILIILGIWWWTQHKKKTTY